MNDDETSPRAAGDPLLEVQAAIDELVRLAWERWGEHVPVAPVDVRDALVDLRPIVRELDGLWQHLRQSLRR